MDVKNMWTDFEFDDLGWHDCRLYSIQFPDENFKLSFDIDYIFQWEAVNDEFKFWVSPCDLIFSDVSELKVELNYKNSMLLFISEVRRSSSRLSPNGKMIIWDYLIECDHGKITFSATGFQQNVRYQPVLSESQDLRRR
jgi:hypothetical protein